MRLTIIIVALLFCTQILTCCAQKNKTELNEERIKLKNYAICSCLSKSYPKDSVFIKDGSQAAYFELSAYNIEAFESIDSLAKIYSIKHLSSKHNRPLVLMNCLDFYNSNDLKNLILGLDKEIDPVKLKENK